MKPEAGSRQPKRQKVIAVVENKKEDCEPSPGGGVVEGGAGFYGGPPKYIPEKTVHVVSSGQSLTHHANQLLFTHDARK